MAQRLFGLDIAAMVRDGLNEAGGVLSMTLVKVTKGNRTASALADGTNPTEASYPCEGFDETAKSLAPGTLLANTRRIVGVLGASLPVGIEPDVHDKLTVDGVTYRINAEVQSDAARALHVCQVVS